MMITMNSKMKQLLIWIEKIDQCHECHEPVTNHLVTLLTSNHQYFRGLSRVSLTFKQYIFIQSMLLVYIDSIYTHKKYININIYGKKLVTLVTLVTNDQRY